MATKIQQILESHPNSSLFFGNWLTKQGLNSKEQHSYMKRGWLTRISKGVYALKGNSPTLLQTVAAYNSQLGKQCIVGAYTALELRGIHIIFPSASLKPTCLPTRKTNCPYGLFKGIGTWLSST